MNKMFTLDENGERKVLNTNVIGKYDQLYSKSLKLKDYKELYRFYRMTN